MLAPRGAGYGILVGENNKFFYEKTFKTAADAAILAIAGVTVFNANQDAELTDLQMENVEALADGESGLGVQCKYDYILNDCYRTAAYIPYCASFGCPK